MGVGKSSLANTLIGSQPGPQCNPECPFPVCTHNTNLCTLRSKAESGNYIRNVSYPNFTVIDTPGISSGVNFERKMDDMIRFFEVEIRSANGFLLLLNGKSDLENFDDITVQMLR